MSGDYKAEIVLKRGPEGVCRLCYATWTLMWAVESFFNCIGCCLDFCAIGIAIIAIVLVPMCQSPITLALDQSHEAVQETILIYKRASWQYFLEEQGACIEIGFLWQVTMVPNYIFMDTCMCEILHTYIQYIMCHQFFFYFKRPHGKIFSIPVRKTFRNEVKRSCLGNNPIREYSS